MWYPARDKESLWKKRGHSKQMLSHEGPKHSVTAWNFMLFQEFKSPASPAYIFVVVGERLFSRWMGAFGVELNILHSFFFCQITNQM